jgi:arylsulfatase A-like enzyme
MMFALWALAAAELCLLSPTEAAPPNIVMIFTDDQGYHDVGCYGSEIDTPHIDQLAADGMRFTQFYAASSICTPSRYGLLTGQFSHRSKDGLLSALMFLTEADRHRGIRPGELTYAGQLQQAGYHTALVGKWHLGHGEEQFWPTRHGFDTFFGHTGGCVDFFTLGYGNRPDWYRGRQLVDTAGYATDVITDEAIKVLRARGKSDQPLYLHISYNAPHFGKGWNEARQTTENVMQPKPADLKKVMHIDDPLRRAFAAKVVGMDEGIGRLLQTLDELSISENTLVIFMTDHGGDENYGGSNLPLRGGKATLFEGGIRVPCIVRWPAVVATGTVTDSVACAIDWFATFGQIAGFEVADRDGISILPILRGEHPDRQRTLIWKTGAHAELERESWAAVRRGDWKWVKPPGEKAMLFDLAKDPSEQTDLADSRPKLAEQLAAMASKD